jgi:hypothetical protein
VFELSYILTKFALRCLIGCNIGEGIGAAIGFTLGWGMISTLVLAVGLAFAVGYAFTIIPMLKTMSARQAVRVTVVGDTASIAAMEITENSLVFVIPRLHACCSNGCIILARSWNNTTSRLCNGLSCNVLGYEA